MYLLFNTVPKNINNTQAFLDSDKEVNVIILAYVSKLGFCIRRINVGVEKIYRSTFAIFEIVVANFQV